MDSQAGTKAKEIVNGYDVGELRGYVEKVNRDPSVAERNPVLTAHWVGESRARVEFKNSVMHVGGEGEPSAMSALLASLAACDVEVISTHAALLGIQLESLSIEARGHFNVQAFLGVEGAPGSGYDQISYTIKIRAPAATPEQLAYLRERCERSSPVGDSLGRPIPLKLELVTEP